MFMPYRKFGFYFNTVEPLNIMVRICCMCVGLDISWFKSFLKWKKTDSNSVNIWVVQCVQGSNFRNPISRSGRQNE